jgi:hypothetical protein
MSDEPVQLEYHRPRRPPILPPPVLFIVIVATIMIVGSLYYGLVYVWE